MPSKYPNLTPSSTLNADFLNIYSDNCSYEVYINDFILDFSLVASFYSIKFDLAFIFDD